MFRGRDVLVYWYSNYMPYTELDLGFIDIVGHYNSWPNENNPTHLVVGGTVPNAGLVNHVHAAGKKIILLVGGADDPDGPIDAGFKALCGSGSSAADRTAFAATAWQYAIDHGYDGIDLDWEWPGTDTPPAYDFSANYADLIVKLGTSPLQGARTLSVGTTVNDLNGKFIPVGTLNAHTYLDWYGVQTYGQHGPTWSPHVGHAAELHSSGGDNEKHWPYGLPDTQTPSADQAIDYWRSRGVPRSKIVLGIGLYGNNFPSDEGLYEPNAGGQTDPYRTLKPLTTSWTLTKDQESEAWYWSNPGGAGVISMPVPETVTAMLRLADAERLKGVMIWAASQDAFYIEPEPPADPYWVQELMGPLAAESGKLRWIWLSPQKFTAAAGAPSLAARGSAADAYRAACWALPRGAEHALTTSFAMPADWDSAYPIRPFLHWTWASPGDLADLVNWECVVTTVTTGQQVDQAGTVVDPAWGPVRGPTVVEGLGRTPIGGYTPGASGLVRMAVRRAQTADPNLDYPGDAWLLGIEIQYVATS